MATGLNFICSSIVGFRSWFVCAFESVNDRRGLEVMLCMELAAASTQSSRPVGRGPQSTRECSDARFQYKTWAGVTKWSTEVACRKAGPQMESPFEALMEAMIEFKILNR